MSDRARAMLDAEPRPLRLAAEEIAGNHVLTGRDVHAWYVLPPVQWSFTSDTRRMDTLRRIALGYAALAGREVHLRTLPVPVSAAEWARDLHADIRAAGTTPPDPAGFADRMVAIQQHLHTRSLSTTETYLGVPLFPRRLLDRIGARTRKGRTTTRERQTIADAAAEVEDAVTSGLGGRPATQSEVEWLVHRSVGLHLPEPRHLLPHRDPVDPDDMWVFTDPVDTHHHPGLRLWRIVGHPHRSDQHAERYVAVLSLGRMEDMAADAAWIAATQRLPFPVEWSVRAKILAGDDTAAEMRHKLGLVRDQREQYRAHDLDEPGEVERVARAARLAEDRMESGTELEATSVKAWLRLAVAGRSPDEVRDRVRRVTRLYRDMQVTVEWPRAQHDLHREFVPGEPRTQTCHRRVMPLDYWASGLPQRVKRLGTGRGFYRGVIAGTARDAVFWDMWEGMEVHDASGLTPVIGGLGAGKSGLLGACARDAAAAGVHSTIFDRSGPLAALCSLVPQSRHRDLLDGAPGDLSPWGIVAVPRLAQFVDHPKVRAALAAGATTEQVDALVAQIHREAVVVAEQTRKLLAQDVAKMLLPAAFAESEQVPLLIADAVRAVGGHWTNSMFQVVEHLEGVKDPTATRIAHYLRDMAELPQSRLFFSSGAEQYRHARAEPDRPDEVLLVITMAGLVQPPESVPRAHWSTEEQVGLALLHLAAHFATRRIYGRPMGERKFVAIDEAHFLANWGSGRALAERLARDTRKWNTRVLFGTQKADDVFGLLEAASLVREVIVGRVEDDTDAAAALRLLGVPSGVGYEQVLTGLSPQPVGATAPLPYREYVMRDVLGQIEVLRADFDHDPALARTLNTRPGTRRREAVVA